MCAISVRLNDYSSEDGEREREREREFVSVEWVPDSCSSIASAISLRVLTA